MTSQTLPPSVQWGLALYFLFSFITDVLSQWTPLPLLKNIRDLVFATITLPLSLVSLWSSSVCASYIMCMLSLLVRMIR